MDERICIVFKNNILLLFYKNFINLNQIQVKSYKKIKIKYTIMDDLNINIFLNHETIFLL